MGNISETYVCGEIASLTLSDASGPDPSKLLAFVLASAIVASHPLVTEKFPYHPSPLVTALKRQIFDSHFLNK